MTTTRTTLRTREEVRSLTFDQMEERFLPLIRRTALKARGVALDVEEIEQELRVCLWRCWNHYRPEAKVGFEGRASSFTNFVLTAFNNCLHKLHRHHLNHGAVVESRTCRGCGTSYVPGEMTRCPECGGRGWTYTYIEGAVGSLERMMETDDGGSLDSLRYAIETQPERLPSIVDSWDVMGTVMRIMSPPQRVAAISVLRGVEDEDDLLTLRGLRGSMVISLLQG